MNVHIDTNGFIATLASFTNLLRSKLWHEKQVNKPISKLALPLALCILKAQEVTLKGMYRLQHASYILL